MAASPAVRVRAFAKINLTLRVLGRRADGYHELRTMFQAIALHDTLDFARTRTGFSIACDDPHCPTDSSNLVWRAAEALWRSAGRRGALRGVSVRIRKRIPMQGGLGGGSSDAAATLRSLSQLWRVRLTQDQLHGISRDIGADVPFFLEGGTALGLDRGDLLFPLVDWPPTAVVVVVPAFGVGTAAAFEWWDKDAGPGGPSGEGRSARTSRDEEFRNDLEPPVCVHHPEIKRIVTRLGRSGASYAAMSGSGSAVFGLFDSEREAHRAAAALARPGQTTVVTQTVSRRKYRRLAQPRSV